MENEKAPRMEELESRQQEMQEKISRATKMVTNLTKGKGITDDLGEPAFWKCGIDKSQIYMKFTFIYLVFCIVYHLFWAF